jgi:hypothetical protein
MRRRALLTLAASYTLPGQPCLEAAWWRPLLRLGPRSRLVRHFHPISTVLQVKAYSPPKLHPLDPNRAQAPFFESDLSLDF